MSQSDKKNLSKQRRLCTSNKEGYVYKDKDKIIQISNYPSL